MRGVRVVVAAEAFGDGLDAAAVAEAIVTGWRRVAPGDGIVVAGPGEVAEVAGADLVVTAVPVVDWQVLRDSPLAALAAASDEHGLPCVVLAGRVLAGHRELGAIGVDAALGTDGPADAAALAALAGRVATRWSR